MLSISFYNGILRPKTLISAIALWALLLGDVYPAAKPADQNEAQPLAALEAITNIPHTAPFDNNRAQTQLSNKEIQKLSLQLFTLQGAEKIPVIEKLSALNDKSLIPTFVLAMRLTGSNVHIGKVLSELTGEPIENWHDAYHWQQRHPEIMPHPSYKNISLKFLGSNDERFLSFFTSNDGSNADSNIRFEEIVWGGVRFDSIPPLDKPKMIDSVDADYLLDSDLVFGVEINGDARAYPLRIMGWHEMLNDVIGGVPVALAYCTLCGSGILFETLLEEYKEPFVFGSSGLLYRSNKLMFDRNTNTLWNQFSGEPVVGDLAKSEIKLNIRPMTITSWQQWQALHADTTVLSLETGHIRNYDSGITYKAYFASPDLMFPAFVNDESQLLRKDYVFGVRSVAASKAWPLAVFVDTPLINDVIGLQPLVLIGDAATRTVRAYQREIDETFVQDSNGIISTGKQKWTLTESFLVSSSGQHRRARLPGHIAYWFAWENFMGLKSELYQAATQ